MGKRWSYMLVLATGPLQAACGGPDISALSSLPGEGGSIFTSGSQTTTPFAADGNGAPGIMGDANVSTGVTTGSVGGTTTSGTTPPGTTTSGSTTSGSTTSNTTPTSTTCGTSGTTAGAGSTSTTGTTASSTTGVATTGGSTVGSTSGSDEGTTSAGGTSGGSGTSEGGASANASAIPSTSGGPGYTSYNPAASNYIAGTVEGVSMTVASALFRDSTDGDEASLVVILSDQANLCATLTAGGQPTNSHAVRMVFDAGSAAWPPDGNYPTDGSGVAVSVTFAFYDANGNETLQSGNAALHAGQAQLSDYAHGPGGDAQGNAQGLVGSQSDGMSIGFNAVWCAAAR